jgi:hypothetical protein
MSRFDERFNALIADGRERKQHHVDRALDLLKQVDSIVEEMRAEGLGVRVELGMGAHIMPSQMRFVVRMEASL